MRPVDCHGTGVRIPPAPFFVVRGNSGNIRKVPANRRLRASRLAGGPFLFLPISGRFVQLHVRIMVRAAFGTITESGDPGEQFIRHIVGVMPATDGHAVAHPQAHGKLWNSLQSPIQYTEANLLGLELGVIGGVPLDSTT